MSLVPDEGSVQQFAAASSDPAFGDRVHTGRPDVAKNGADAGVGEGVGFEYTIVEVTCSFS
jgi:hypothetical protein